MLNTLVIPDLHCPYQHPDAADFLRDVAKRVGAKKVVCIGDEVDFYGISRFTSDPDMASPGRELSLARKALKPLFKIFPSVAVCHSNHVQRPLKAAAAARLPDGLLRSIGAVLGAPRGWKWAWKWDVSGVRFYHGDGLSGGRAAHTAINTNRRSVVFGHLHGQAGVTWSHGPDDRLFALQVGCLIDYDSPAFDYSRHHPSKPALGCGVIEDGVPRWVPL